MLEWDLSAPSSNPDLSWISDDMEIGKNLLQKMQIEHPQVLPC